jgi:hypothetical protein
MSYGGASNRPAMIHASPTAAPAAAWPARLSRNASVPHSKHATPTAFMLQRYIRRTMRSEGSSVIPRHYRGGGAARNPQIEGSRNGH